MAGEQAKLPLLHPMARTTAWTTPHHATEKLSSTKPVLGSKMVGDRCPIFQHIQKLTPVLHRPDPACRGTFGGRRKAVRDRLALQGGTGDFP